MNILGKVTWKTMWKMWETYVWRMRRCIKTRRRLTAARLWGENRKTAENPC